VVELKEFMIINKDKKGHGVLIKDDVYDFRIAYYSGGGQVFNIEDAEEYIDEVYMYDGTEGDIKYYAFKFFVDPYILSLYKKIYAFN